MPTPAARGRRQRARRASTRGPCTPWGRNRAARLELVDVTRGHGHPRVNQQPIRGPQLAKSAQQRDVIVRLERNRVGRVAKHVDERIDESERDVPVAELGVSISSTTTGQPRNGAEQTLELEVGYDFELAPEHRDRSQRGNECVAGGQ